MAPGRGPRRSLAGAPGCPRGRGKSGGARAAKGGARGLGSPPARQAGPGRHLGWRVVIGRRVVLPKVGFHDLHDAALARLGFAGSNPQAQKACTLLLDQGLQRDGGINYGWTPSETCITGMVLSILAYFEYDDDRLDTIADHLLAQQMPDGGWNCRRRFGATH